MDPARPLSCADRAATRPADGSRRRAFSPTALLVLGLSMLVLLPLPAPVAAQLVPLPADTAQDVAPEAASGRRAMTSVTADRAMVATANPLASEVALAVLRQGGHALDAAIAAQWVLGLVEPQSSGLGGGGFLVSWQAAERRLTTWDGRETAPAAVDDALFLAADGRPMPFARAVVGGRSVGTPGLVRMLEEAHRRDGRLPWGALAQPAIRLARDGFEVSPRLATLIARDPALAGEPAAANYFYRAPEAREGDGPVVARKPLTTGQRLRNPDYATTLETIAREGSNGLHQGPLAQAVVRAVREHGTNPGRLSLADLAGYRAIERPPLCAPWRRWVVCGPPPPSSGTLAVLQMLGILEQRDQDTLLQTHPPMKAAADATLSIDAALSVDGIHWFSEAGRLAYADRDRYVADPDFVPRPRGLLDPQYLAARAALLQADRSIGKAEAGVPAELPAPSPSKARLGAGLVQQFPETGTTHLSVVDAEGNAVSMTTTIESAFGSRQFVAGFLLNNQLTDFAFQPRRLAADDKSDASVANRVAPGKRPRSSMAPLLVFERDPAAAGRLGALVMVTGSPGGSAIINYVARTVILVLQDGLDPQRAAALANIGSRNGATEVEIGQLSEPVLAGLRARGHTISAIEQTSGIQTLVRRGGRWTGSADPRREGLVVGLD